MSAPGDVFDRLDKAVNWQGPHAAAAFHEARAAVAELVEAAKGVRAAAILPLTVAQAAEAHARLDAALAKFGGA